MSMNTVPGASELMRQMGLLVDGPLLWSAPVNSRRPGVFVVELPQPLPRAPLDERALRRWIELVPQMRLAGEEPTPRDLALHLARFWLPNEPILYVGRSARALGPRVAALYATPLGASRPHPGGHWLKTLANLGQLRLWWAETDAQEEYEDALLSDVAARQPPEARTSLATGEPLLPFANLEDGSGGTKGHLLEHSLVASSDTAAAKPSPPGRRPVQRAEPARRATIRRPSARPSAQARTPAEPNYVTPEGLEKLVAELDELRTGVRPGVVARVKAARELGDLRENAEYESARKEQSFVEGRIQALEGLVKRASIIQADAGGSGGVAIGSTVVVESDGQRDTFVLVGSSEADPSAGRISYASPVGQALLGRREGDEVAARLPRGEVRYVVREVR